MEMIMLSATHPTKRRQHDTLPLLFLVRGHRGYSTYYDYTQHPTRYRPVTTGCWLFSLERVRRQRCSQPSPNFSFCGLMAGRRHRTNNHSAVVACVSPSIRTPSACVLGSIRRHAFSLAVLPDQGKGFLAAFILEVTQCQL